MEQKQLIKEALKAKENAYVPYSHFQVGAALLMKDGTVVHGANIENGSFGLTNCAERSALFSAYSQGYKKDDIIGMAVVGNTEGPISPCGACRQVITELVNKDIDVILSNEKYDTKIFKVKELIPYAFDPEVL